MASVRITISINADELDEIEKYSSEKAIPRNELIRRATLTYVRHQDNPDKTLDELFSNVGFLGQEKRNHG